MKNGFTLIELLVVIAITAMLSAFTAMAVQKSMQHAYQTRCTSSLRQLATANQLYAADHGSYVPAARDIWSGGGGMERWHGIRAGIYEPFDALKGPLFPYLGSAEGLRRCPEFKNYHTGIAAFERGCGGYGYNQQGIGSRSYQLGTKDGAELGMTPGSIASPAQTLMFADTAFPKRSRNGSVLIEYSFAEAYFPLKDSVPTESDASIEDQSKRSSPSIHFRHDQKAGAVWTDGHVSFEPVNAHTTYSSSTRDNIGWLGESSNELFDPF